ncbi:MAG: M23 family metallopeptidase [Hyphomonadaceae bacterium]|nr:M23 family metallopeptidase [Clostridia bacterium]
MEYVVERRRALARRYGKSQQRVESHTPYVQVFFQQLIAAGLIFLMLWGMKHSEVNFLHTALSRFNVYLNHATSITTVYQKMDKGVKASKTFYHGALAAMQPLNKAKPAFKQDAVPKPTAIPPEKNEVKAVAPVATAKPTAVPAPSITFKSPMAGALTSKFGMRFHPVYKKELFHYGVDIAGEINHTIYAAADGKVLEVGKNDVYGKFVRIAHTDDFETFYGHLNGYTVKKDAQVKKGQAIAKMGNTGLVVGPGHLHFEIRKNKKALDPLSFITVAEQ